MEFGIRDSLLTVGSTALMLAGIAMILLRGATLTSVGIVLVTLGTIVFIVDAKDLLVKTDQNAGD